MPKSKNPAFSPSSKAAKTLFGSSSKPSHKAAVEAAALVGLKATLRILKKLDVPEEVLGQLGKAIQGLGRHLRSKK